MQAAGTTGLADRPALPARCLTVYTRSPWGPGLFAPITRGQRLRHARRLDLSIGRPGPRDFTVHQGSFVGTAEPCCDPSTHRIPHPTSVTTAKRPLVGAGRSGVEHKFCKSEREIFEKPKSWPSSLEDQQLRGHDRINPWLIRSRFLAIAFSVTSVTCSDSLSLSPIISVSAPQRWSRRSPSCSAPR